MNVSKMTYEEFLERWSGIHAEWVGGRVVALGPASRTHQDLLDFLTSLLRIFVESYERGVVTSAPFQMKLGPDLPGREPDLLFVARKHLGRLKETYCEGPADLTVEIVSKESRTRDTRHKLLEYESGGVREYWLLDPQEKTAKFYQLVRGAYRRIPVGVDEIFRSRVLDGFWLEVNGLWEDPLPPVMKLLGKLGLIP